MSFTKKNLQSSRRGMTFLKGATLFFLGMSCILFITRAFEITPIASNTIQYIKTIFLTTDGSNASTTKISLDGVNGDGNFAGTVNASAVNATTINGTTINGTTVTATTLSGTTIKGTTVNATNVNANLNGITITGTNICLGGVCNTARPTAGGASVWSTGSAGKIYYTGENVGIGTNNPASKLHIYGVTPIINIEGETEGDGGIQMIKFSDSDNSVFSQIKNNSEYGEFTLNTLGSMIFGTNNIERIRIGSNGNVGIGTTSPTSLLHLSGANNTGNIRFQNSGFIEAGSNPYQFFLGISGNVGIGTNNPTQKFQVSDFAQIGSNVSCAENPSSGGYFLRLFVTEGAATNCGFQSPLSTNTKVNIQLNNYGTQDDDNWKIQNDKSFMSFGYATGSLVYENMLKINSDYSIQLQETTTGSCNSTYRGKIKIIAAINPSPDRLCFCGLISGATYGRLFSDGTTCQ